MNLNLNLVLGAVVVVVLAVIGALVAILLLGGPSEVVLTRAALLTGFAVPVLTSLLALFRAERASSASTQAQEETSQHSDELEAARTRIAYLENLNGVPPPPAIHKDA